MFFEQQIRERLNSDVENCEFIVSRLKSTNDSENTLAQEVKEKRWSRRKILFNIYVHRM